VRRGWLTVQLCAAALAAAGVVAQESRPGAQEPEAEAQQEPAPGARQPGAPDGEPAARGAQGAATDTQGSQESDSGAEEQVADAESDDVPYTVECDANAADGGNPCQVDRATYVGWRTFHAVCHTCHAQDAVGSSFAPALLPRIRLIDKARFLEVVDQGYTGQVGVMPGWGTNPNVNRYYDELWAYLRARADGVLPPGRPKRLPDE